MPTRRHLLAGAAGLLAAPAVLRTSPAQAAAPSLGPAQPRHYRFPLGAFEVTTILDAGAVIDGPYPIVGQDQQPDVVAGLMRHSLLPEKRFQPGFTPTLVNTGAQLILFDTGNGAGGFVPRPDGGWLAGQLQTAGFAPGQVDLVVLSHAHPDHIGGILEGGMPLFPNARYVMGAAEYAFWAAQDDRLKAPKDSLEHQSAALFQKAVVPLADRLRLVTPGEAVAPGITAVAAFGHTPGHLAFHVESQGRQLLIWGDCAHHEVASLAEPGWHALFDMDKEQGAATRRHIYDMAATDRLAVVGYHTSFPSIGFVERRGANGYRWIPVTYQFRV
ncbi:MBL fold metallo-hydrolase [Nitrospirillum viridazoti]|uniref:Glyoxylase-like metal-dependent hydrolase (Beta-lactamase superfamily II) n=1 Tax=Nitrospirillum amazonense TaxID=28077 RepID=A0A560IBB7_9PROT|nr:MBL fold metallo-hydrolase [Nitrospirillum amazonense]TWB56332.1 glyoxylase-like metal-dependent hydrolase (beta-lactamase superfamily II) [Nitrospirillum amazonense]